MARHRDRARGTSKAERRRKLSTLLKNSAWLDGRWIWIVPAGHDADLELAGPWTPQGLSALGEGLWSVRTATLGSTELSDDEACNLLRQCEDAPLTEQIHVQLADTVPISTSAISTTSKCVVETERFPHRMAEAVQNPAEWRARARARLRLARSILDADRSARGTLARIEAALPIRAGSPAVARFVRRAEELEAFMEADPTRPGAAAAALMLGQGRTKRRVPPSVRAWSALGAVVPWLPAPLLMAIARELGGPEAASAEFRHAFPAGEIAGAAQGLVFAYLHSDANGIRGFLGDMRRGASFLSEAAAKSAEVPAVIATLGGMRSALPKETDFSVTFDLVRKLLEGVEEGTPAGHPIAGRLLRTLPSLVRIVGEPTRVLEPVIRACVDNADEWFEQSLSRYGGHYDEVLRIVKAFRAGFPPGFLKAHDLIVSRVLIEFAEKLPDRVESAYSLLHDCNLPWDLARKSPATLRLLLDVARRIRAGGTERGKVLLRDLLFALPGESEPATPVLKFARDNLPLLLELWADCDSTEYGGHPGDKLILCLVAWEQEGFDRARELGERLKSEYALGRQYAVRRPNSIEFPVRVAAGLSGGDLDRAVRYLLGEGEHPYPKQTVEDGWRAAQSSPALRDWLISRVPSDFGETVALIHAMGNAHRLESREFGELLARWSVAVPESRSPELDRTSRDCPEAETEILRLAALSDALGRPIQVPASISRVLAQPEREARELLRLELLESPPPPIAKRIENLRDRLSDPERRAAQARRDCLKRVRAAIEALQRDWLRRICDLPFEARLRRLLVPDEPIPELTLAWRHAIWMMAHLKQNRRLLKRILRGCAAGASKWPVDHPRNDRFWRRLEAAGADAEAWRRGLHRCVELRGEKVTIYTEDDILEALRMGSYFGTCLTAAEFNAYVAVLNACDANKRVMYAVDAGGRVIGRKLIGVVLTKTGAGMVGYSTYGRGASRHSRIGNGALGVEFDLCCIEFARACRLELINPESGSETPEPEPLLNTVWESDGEVAFDFFWQRHSPQDLLHDALGAGALVRETIQEMFEEGPYESARRRLAWLGDAAVPWIRRELEGARQIDGGPAAGAYTSAMDELLDLLREIGTPAARSLALEHEPDDDTWR